MNKRKLELLGYFVVILYFIGSAVMDDEKGDHSGRAGARMGGGMAVPRVSRPPKVPQPSGNIIPVTVDVGAKRGNSTGTGFAYDGMGQYVTARHVTEGCRDVYVLTSARSGAKGSVAAMPDSDFAVISVKNSKDPKAISAPRVEIARQKPKRGDVGYFMGYPGGEAADVKAVAYGNTTMSSQGRYRFREPVTVWLIKERRPAVASLVKGLGDDYYNLAGISGGPAFNSAGEIIGTVVAGQPRRARAVTTDIDNFSRFRSLARAADRSTVFSRPTITDGNFTSVGGKLRADLTIAKIYCKVM